MALILNPAQAEAVYSAMCALNSVGGEVGSIGLRDDHGLPISVQVTRQGMWCVLSARHSSEWHDDQAAFATAYGLQPGGRLLDLAREMEAFSEAAMNDAIEAGETQDVETWRARMERCQSAIAAYGLNGDDWQSDVAAAAGGLTQTAIER